MEKGQYYLSRGLGHSQNRKMAILRTARNAHFSGMASTNFRKSTADCCAIRNEYGEKISMEKQYNRIENDRPQELKKLGIPREFDS